VLEFATQLTNRWLVGVIQMAKKKNGIFPYNLQQYYFFAGMPQLYDYV